MQILTKDSVTVFVNAIMYYRVKDPISAVTNVDDYAGSAQALAATTLRQGWVYYLPEELYTIKIQDVSKKVSSWKLLLLLNNIEFHGAFFLKALKPLKPPTGAWNANRTLCNLEVIFPVQSGT